MPELPEVETTRRGIAPHVVGHRITNVVVREPRLRWPVALPRLTGMQVQAVERRAKYLCLVLPKGGLIIHLGMAGHLRVVSRDTPASRHAHVDVVLDNGLVLRLTDPRRFGSVHFAPGDWRRHPLLEALGPEPFAAEFDADYLHRHARGKRVAVKNFVMDAHIVVGVGNIYANEALFRAGIRPRRAAGRVTRAEFEKLAAAIRATLTEAIAAGGTTLRDFLGAEGEAGYFTSELKVYGRESLPCVTCGQTLKAVRLGGRATVYCPRCQR